MSRSHNLQPDPDSAMKDDDSSSPESQGPSTPPSHILPPSSELSPPDSRGGVNPRLASASATTPPTTSAALAGIGFKMPPSASLNANGKRSWKDAGKGKGKDGGAANGGASVIDNTFGGGLSARGKSSGGDATVKAVKVDEETGYSWNNESDAPGWSWTNKAAREEHSRYWNAVQDRERMLKNRFGDVLSK